jgi:hypothetical protein
LAGCSFLILFILIGWILFLFLFFQIDWSCLSLPFLYFRLIGGIYVSLLSLLSACSSVLYPTVFIRSLSPSQSSHFQLFKKWFETYPFLRYKNYPDGTDGLWCSDCAKYGGSKEKDHAHFDKWRVDTVTNHANTHWHAASLSRKALAFSPSQPKMEAAIATASAAQTNQMRHVFRTLYWITKQGLALRKYHSLRSELLPLLGVSFSELHDRYVGNSFPTEAIHSIAMSLRREVYAFLHFLFSQSVW